ncbi:MAG: DUF3035 domain-containing protein [Gluconacetobacter diazotrophicus]|nr:DUF3035 domain-containing protein [Gluconacetobacter diazotrophicus]
MADRFRSVLIAAAVLGLGPVLGACSGNELERDFGLVRVSPDEYTVTTHAPLVMPTDNALAKPTPGVDRPADQDTQTQALETLAPNVALQGTGGTGSPGQDALVSSAASSSAQAPTGALDHPSQGFVNELMFWQGGQVGDVVDASAERKRLQEDAALGRPPTAGATPTVKASRPGFFSRMF